MLRLLASLAALLLAAPAAAQTAPSAPVRPDPAFSARAQELVRVLQGGLAYDGYFSPAFRAAVPKDKFDGIVAQLGGNGPVTGIERIEPATPWSGTVTVRYRDALVTMRLTVEETPPHQVKGLLITGLSGVEKTLGKVTSALETLHGSTGFAFARLGEGPPELLVQHNAGTPFAVGSAFKLVILAELVRATNAGERHWDDKVTIDGTPLPGGEFTFVPKGAQVAIRDLALEMISISDNSATDILLRTLGREKVEAMLPVLGVHPDPRNRPYLSTMEAFKLKGLENGAVGRRYLALDEAGKRAMLAGEVAAADASSLNATLYKDGMPVMIDTLEWFFTPADLVRVMDWLRRNTEGPKGAEARAILSKNPGVPLDKAQYRWTGFKGGSEPGVLDLTLLLQGTDGNWYVATASWNDPAAPVDTQRLVALVASFARLAHP